MTSALSGFTILDLTQGLCGPFAAMRLGDSGMEVIKVEPLEGDASRTMGPPFVGHESATFLSLNRNKKSIALDFESAEGIAIVRKLISNVDVVLEDWGPARLVALGLDYEDLMRTYPGLVWCSITAFGETGPMCELPGSELVVQALSDYPNSLGELGSEPVRMGTDAANMNCAIFASQGITAALFHKIRSGQGQRVCVSQLGALLHTRGLMWTAQSEPDDWFGLFNDHYTRGPDYGYRTKNGPVYWGLRRGDSEDWDRLLMELGMLEYLDDPRFANFGRNATSIGRYGPEVKPIWEHAFNEKDLRREQVIELILSVKGDAVPFADYATLLRHPQIAELEIVVDIERPTDGTFKAIGPVWRFSDTPAKISRPPPKLGQHTTEILASAGFENDDALRAIASGAVRYYLDDSAAVDTGTQTVNDGN
jgi:crotonobetainyl-CoA:carnitine CoA-transferase CaiB-like acyl-CoA transferase